MKPPRVSAASFVPLWAVGLWFGLLTPAARPGQQPDDLPAVADPSAVVVDASRLGDGESRTLGADSGWTVSREGGRVTFAPAGDRDASHAIGCDLERDRCLVVIDPASGPARLIVHRDSTGPEAPSAPVDLRLRFRSGEEGDRIALRCPENDLYLTLETRAEGDPRCPRHQLELIPARRAPTG